MAIYYEKETNKGVPATYWHPQRFTSLDRINGRARVMMAGFYDYDAREANPSGALQYKEIAIPFEEVDNDGCVWTCIYQYIASNEYDGMLSDGQKYQPENGDTIDSNGQVIQN